MTHHGRYSRPGIAANNGLNGGEGQEQGFPNLCSSEAPVSQGLRLCKPAASANRPESSLTTITYDGLPSAFESAASASSAIPVAATSSRPHHRSGSKRCFGSRERKGRNERRRRLGSEYDTGFDGAEISYIARCRGILYLVDSASHSPVPPLDSESKPGNLHDRRSSAHPVQILLAELWPIRFERRQIGFTLITSD